VCANSHLNHAGKGGDQEHWCVRIGKKKKNPTRKEPGKWTFSYAHYHGGGGGGTKAVAEKGKKSFRELLDFGETKNVKALRGSEVRWSDQAETRRIEIQRRLKAGEGTPRRERRQLGFDVTLSWNVERDRAVLNPTAVSKRSCPKKAASAPPPASKTSPQKGASA
jgi:hypothetical protein